MSHKFIEVTTDHPTTGEIYKLLLQIDQVVQVQPEVKIQTEPQHEPLAVVVLTSGETIILKNTYNSLVKQFNEVNMVMRS